MNMLLGTSEGQSYSEKEITEFLESNGLGEIKRISLPEGIPSGIIMGVKK
jgi:hypothetical protein